MRVFISSVRGGLEAERDALPGLLKAIGHEPVRFEDFSAQPDPSRQACMDGVDSSDAYILLLGPRYGHRFPDTGQSPTHDEYVRARTRGIPKLVFLKEGVTHDPDQTQLISQIRDYASGSFHDSFSDVGDLLPKVATALAGLAERSDALTYQSLATAPQFAWVAEWENATLGRGRHDPLVELHVKPLSGDVIPSRVMRTTDERLITAFRQTGAVAPHAGLQPVVEDASVLVLVPDAGTHRHNEVRSRQLRGARVDRSGQISLWWTLPSDGMGGILNESEVTEAFSTYLRLVSAIGVDDGRRYAVAAGVSGSMISVVDGDLGSQSRSGASFGFTSDDPVRVLPDESVSTAAFDGGALEVGRDIATRVMAAFRNRR